MGDYVDLYFLRGEMHYKLPILHDFPPRGLYNRNTGAIYVGSEILELLGYDTFEPTTRAID